MDHIAAAEERMVSERLRQKLNQINNSAQSQLSSVQDHVNFTLQKAYFLCAYECFDRNKNPDEMSHCVENCSVPVVRAQQLVENEMAQFQERLQRSLMVCQDKFETAKAQQAGSGAMMSLESCVDQSIQDGIQTLPHIVNKLKNALYIRD